MTGDDVGRMMFEAGKCQINLEILIADKISLVTKSISFSNSFYFFYRNCFEAS